MERTSGVLLRPRSTVHGRQTSSFLKDTREQFVPGPRSNSIETASRNDTKVTTGVAESYPQGSRIRSSHELHTVIIIGSEDCSGQIDAERWPGYKSLMPYRSSAAPPFALARLPHRPVTLSLKQMVSFSQDTRELFDTTGVAESIRSSQERE